MQTDENTAVWKHANLLGVSFKKRLNPRMNLDIYYSNEIKSVPFYSSALLHREGKWISLSHVDCATASNHQGADSLMTEWKNWGMSNILNPWDALQSHLFLIHCGFKEHSVKYDFY